VVAEVALAEAGATLQEELRTACLGESPDQTGEGEVLLDDKRFESLAGCFLAAGVGQDW
jgi:hypothetical protein